jgi:stage III sporulation protein AH
MQAKRQTVWLVSMLSLMVVLSAYYLFTEDVNQLEFTATGTAPVNEVKVSTGEHSTPSAAASATGVQKDQAANADSAAKSSSVQTQNQTQTQSQDQSKTQVQTDAKASSVSSQTSSTATGAAGSAVNTDAAKTDAKVLEQMAQAKTGADYFVSLQLKRNEDFGKETEKLMSVITDSKQTTEAVSKAYEEMRKLEDKEAKVTNLEEVLMKDFPQVVINEDNGKWKAIVQANKLERSQAVTIVDKMMSELGVGKENVSVQYKP